MVGSLVCSDSSSVFCLGGVGIFVDWWIVVFMLGVLYGVNSRVLDCTTVLGQGNRTTFVDIARQPGFIWNYHTVISTSF